MDRSPNEPDPSAGLRLLNANGGPISCWQPVSGRRSPGAATSRDGGPRVNGEIRLPDGVSLNSLFLAVGNARFRETQVISDALDRIAALLPAPWRLDAHLEKQVGDGRFDAVVELVGPNAAMVSFAVQAKRSGSVSVSLLIPALRELRRTSGMPVLYVSDYIGPTLRAALASEEFSFADATGWVRVTSTDPLITLTWQGATRSPRGPRAGAVTRLNRLAVSRTIRALVTTDLPVGVRGLAGLAHVSPGSVSKLLATLASEGIVDRDENGRVVAVRRRALLRRWAVDYSFARANPSVAYFIAPRGLDRALARLAELRNVAITGSAAARLLLPESSTSVVPLRLLAIYAARPAEAADELGLIAAEPTTANVVIARPQDPDILAQPEPDIFAQPGDGDLVTAPLPLVIADLLTLPGRSDAEAEQLMDALAVADEAWRE